jgi:serine/threonine protein kinase
VSPDPGRDSASADASELWRRVSRALDEVYARDGAARDEWLARLAEADPLVFREVVGLLAADPQTSRLLDAATRAAAESWLGDDELVGVRVGDWRLLRPLGRGGMGEVFLVEREGAGFEQRAALKLLKRGLDSTEVLARFLRERQILARLEHPGIARLLDGGLAADGRPFFVLEHVEGRPITEHAAVTGLDVGARIRLLLTVADAVEAAHRALVVHRDLKPSNILVTAAGEVKLLDFGIAKLLAEEDATATHTGLRLLTPAYAAPEQIRGGVVTTATDVFALGAVAYELLAAGRPFARTGATPGELIETLASERLERPSHRVRRLAAETTGTERAALERRSRLLAGDLDAILETALAPEPERRYPTAAAFAEDLRRHLERRPIAARRSSRRYRAGRFVARHRVALAAATLAALSLAGGLVAALWQAHRAGHEAGRARTVQSYLVSIFESADPSHALGASLSARQLLATGVRRIDRELASDPQTRAELEDALARSYIGLGLAPEAKSLADRAIADFVATLGSAAPRTSLARLTRAQVDLLESRPAAAEEAARRALPEVERAYGSDSLEVARADEVLAGAMMGEMRLGEAIERHQAAVAIMERRLGRDDPRTAEVLGELAESYGDIGRIPEAEATASDALARLARAGGAGSPQAMNILRFEGDMYNFLDRLPEAEQAYRRAIEIGRKTLGPGHPAFAVALLSLGVSLVDRGLLAQARAPLEEAVGVLEPMGSMDAATGLIALSRSLRLQGRLAEAEAMARRAEAFSLEHGGPDHVRVWLSRSERVSSDLCLGRATAAEPLERAVLGAFTRMFGPGSSHVALSKILLGGVLREQGRLDEAIDLHRFGGPEADRVEHLALHDPLDSPALELALDLMERRQAGDLPEARRALDRALSHPVGDPSSQGLYRATLESASGRLAWLEGDRVRARRELADAVRLLTPLLAPDAPALLAARSELARLR